MTNPTARETPDLRDEPTTLREMLEFVADWAHECAEGDEPDNFYGFAEIEGQCRLALATPEPAPAVLDDERFVRLATAVMQLREFLALHRKATGRSDVNIRKVLALLDDALRDAASLTPGERAATPSEATDG